MRRFEREIQGRQRFYEVDLIAETLVVRTGEIGRSARETRRSFNTPELAAKAFAEAIAAMSGPWTEVTVTLDREPIPEDIAAALADPESPAGYLVISDRLQAEGDPRGRWIALHVAKQAGQDVDSALEEYREAHRDALMGGFAGMDAELTWFCGTVRRAELTSPAGSNRMGPALDALDLDVHFVERLILRGGAVDPPMMALRRRTWSRLTALELDAPEQPLTVSPGDLAKRLPALRTLTLRTARAPALALGGFELETLRVELDDPARLDRMVLPPTLRRLALHVHADAPLPWTEVLRAIDRPLDELELGGVAAIAVLEHWDRSAALGALRLVDSPRGDLLLELLWGRQDAFRGVAIQFEGIDLSENALARVASLDIETDLPDVAVQRGRLYATPSQEQLRFFVRDGRFWEIRRDGTQIHTRSGKEGHKGRSNVSDHRDVEAAARAYKRRVDRRRAGGWVERTPPTTN